MYYGTCSTAAATQAKTVSITGFPTTLTAGLCVRIIFSNAQTYNGAPTLKVGSTTAKTIRRITGTSAAQYEWQAGEAIDFVYNGTYWIIVKGQDRVQYGSYIGTGTYGSSDANTLTLNFPPKLLIIQNYISKVTQSSNAQYTAVLMWRSGDSTFGGASQNYSNPYPLTGTRSGNTVTWYSGASKSAQMNNESYTYNYIAIG